MASAGHAIRGSRVGAGPMGETERGDIAPRARISYWCANGHETQPAFAVALDFEPPQRWDCTRCGFPAGLDPSAPPPPVHNEPYKTHLAYVKERRSDAEGAALLDEALTVLRRRRGEVA
ncbi:RNA polymerase-binding protein RbpA [Xylanimonas sp. McL0601]|uniref:RNA polymerase-binding protein RbpA n=1 Tax=Xylanimonas sp. McL0601 TaxID=3414739 RepID=UPI003CEE0535